MSDAPEHLRAMMDAYKAATGLRLTLSYARMQALAMIAALDVEDGEEPFGAADVAAVMGELKRLIARGAHGYTEASLDFRNAILDVDKFEERARKLRQRALRLRGTAPKRLEATTTKLPDGSTVTRLALPQPDDAPRPVSLGSVKAAVRKLADDLGRPA
jgi:hypothetical protein